MILRPEGHVVKWLVHPKKKILSVITQTKVLRGWNNMRVGNNY